VEFDRDVGDIFSFDFGDSIALWVIAIAAGVLLFWFGGPIVGLALFGFEWLLLLMVIPLLAMWRLIARRPWPILVESADQRIGYAVVGWRASQAAMRRIGDNIRATGWPPSDPAR
jgi:hypothetical protein